MLSDSSAHTVASWGDRGRRLHESDNRCILPDIDSSDVEKNTVSFRWCSQPLRDNRLRQASIVTQSPKRKIARRQRK